MNCYRRWLLVVIAGIGAPVACALSAKEGGKVEELYGTWEAVAIEFKGVKVSKGEEEKGGMRLVFAKDKVTWQFHRPTGEVLAFDGVYKTDGSKKPKLIDLTEPDKGKRTALGIYKIERDLLTISMGKERPKDFSEPSLIRVTFKKKRGG